MVTVGYSNIHLSLTDQTFSQKISNYIEDLNNQYELTDI
jgi:hypothetical protein